MTTIASNIQLVRARIARACASAQRPAQSVTLLNVSKLQSAHSVREAFNAGECHFGENYCQEGLDKMAQLLDLRAELRWHFIGPLQSNKTRLVAQAFDWVHSVDRLKIAQRLSQQRPAHLPPLNICLQVNISGQTSKSGVPPHELAALAQAISTLPGLKLRGLMSIPEPQTNEALQRLPHHALHQLWRSLHSSGLLLDTLSMGMSADLEAAISEGSTLVRIGSAIFGQRTPLHCNS